MRSTQFRKPCLFGRRVAQNASSAGVYGEHPSLTDLDRGELKFNTDFRSVYATVLENWLGAKSVPILGQQFEKLQFV